MTILSSTEVNLPHRTTHQPREIALAILGAPTAALDGMARVIASIVFAVALFATSLSFAEPHIGAWKFHGFLRAHPAFKARYRALKRAAVTDAITDMGAASLSLSVARRAEKSAIQQVRLSLMREAGVLSR